MLQEKATTIATQMGIEQFSGSNGWLVGKVADTLPR